MIASIASPVQNQQESFTLLFLHLLQPTITTQSIHRCQLSTLKLLINLAQVSVLTFSHRPHCCWSAPTAYYCVPTPLYRLGPHRTSHNTQFSYTKMASSGDVKYPAVNGPGKVSQVYFLLRIDCLSESTRLLTLGMTYSDAFRPSLLPFVLISGVRILDDSCIPSEEQRNQVIYSNIALKRRF
jgi:hypothetical protein